MISFDSPTRCRGQSTYVNDCPFHQIRCLIRVALCSPVPGHISLSVDRRSLYDLSIMINYTTLDHGVRSPLCCWYGHFRLKLRSRYTRPRGVPLRRCFRNHLTPQTSATFSNSPSVHMTATSGHLTTQRQRCTVPDFLSALEKGVQKELENRRSLQSDR